MTDLQISACLAYGLTTAWLLLFYLAATLLIGRPLIRPAVAWTINRLIHWQRQRLERKRYEAELRHVRHLRNNILR